MVLNIRDLLKDAKSVCLTGHIRPDGDSVGAVMGLYTYLQIHFPDVKADVYLEPPAGKMKFIVNFDKINSEYPDHEPYDLMICLDASNLERIGQAAKYFHDAKHTINIDHHFSNTYYADENYVEGDSSSACEVLYGFLDPDKLNRDIAIALYTGIIYDTGVFKYRLTSPQTMMIAGELMKYDVPTDEVIDESFYARTYDENRIFGYAVMKSVLACDGRVIYSSLTQKELEDFHVTTRDLEGIVPQLRLTRGVEVAIFAYETTAGDIKVSFRSNDPFDVNEVAALFGGGGHVRAAGANMPGPLEDCIQTLLIEIEKRL
ncbi:MAG: bifunctional oligoribonuclease/PAP phosphatase NrnA [Lachnospiraceae bacterium]|nr:bifunctional oligoribonuclease/PAP phosphatase NrnA [Lachnospiraceae bacterium]